MLAWLLDYLVVCLLACLLAWLLNVPANIQMYLREEFASTVATRCHTMIEDAGHTCYLVPSPHTDTRPTSPRNDPIAPGACQGSSTRTPLLKVIGMTPLEKKQPPPPPPTSASPLPVPPLVVPPPLHPSPSPFPSQYGLIPGFSTFQADALPRGHRGD